MKREMESRIRQEDDQKLDKEKAIIFFEKVVDSARSQQARNMKRSEMCILAVSRSGLMLLAPSGNRPPFARAMQNATWDPSWENHLPRDEVDDLPPDRRPEIVWERQCSDIT